MSPISRARARASAIAGAEIQRWSGRQFDRKRQRKYTIDKRMGCELRYSLNSTHSQKIRFIRFQE